MRSKPLRSTFDFDAAVTAPFRMQPGLRRLDTAAQHLTPIGPDDRHFRDKLQALVTAPQRALLQADGFDAAPALTALAQQAAREHPAAFTWDGTTATSPVLGWAVSAQQLHAVEHTVPHEGAGACLRALDGPWRLPALLALTFAEDFAVLDTGTTQVPWLAVALPSHWDPRDKVGRSFAQVHAPVADNRLLLDAAQALCALVGGPHRWERFVWSIAPHAALNAHPDSVGATRWPQGDAQAVIAQAHWRTERQTFLPVPGRPQALFTILVDTEPLAQAIDSTERAARLHRALASMSPAVLRYRSLHAVREPLLQWLAGRAGL